MSVIDVLINGSTIVKSKCNFDKTNRNVIFMHHLKIESWKINKIYKMKTKI
jgi:hypothetical protein